MAEPVVFKKYSNRRLYDTEQSRYATLSEIAELIHGGRQVRIIDAKTQDDVTAYILTQVVLEQAKNRNTLLPVPLLHLIIQYSDNSLSEFFEKYLHQIIRSYLKFKCSVDGQFQQWLDFGNSLSQATQESLKGLNILQSLFDEFAHRGKDDKDQPL